MFIFRPLKMTLCNEDWFMESAVEIKQHTVLYDVAITWVPWYVYDKDTVVTERGYDFVSLVDANNTRPSGNFLGRLPRCDDSYTGSGAITWIRKGYSGMYRCFAPDSSGYTKSDGNFEAVITPANAQIYPELVFLPEEKMYLFCGGVIGSSLTITPLNFGGGEIISGGVSKTLGESGDHEVDYILNPELPSPARSFLFPTSFGLASEINWSITDAFNVLVESILSDFTIYHASYIENIYLGRITKVGKLQWSNHNFVTEDRSKIVTDVWGMMTLSKRRVSKKIDCDVVITPREGETIVDAIGNTLKFFSFLRGSINVFILNNTGIMEAEYNNILEVPYGDVVTGIIKSCSISDFSASKAVLKVTIASIPTGYRV